MATFNNVGGTRKDMHQTIWFRVCKGFAWIEHYSHMTPSPIFLLFYKIVMSHKNICKSIIMVDLHICYTDT